MVQSITIIFVLLKCSSYFKMMLYSNTCVLEISDVFNGVWSFPCHHVNFLLGLMLVFQLHTEKPPV